jgi:hypothetical protein
MPLNQTPLDRGCILHNPHDLHHTDFMHVAGIARYHHLDDAAGTSEVLTGHKVGLCDRRPKILAVRKLFLV